MTDHPIIFSAPMVRAILDGRKTMTRRIIKLPTKSYSGGPIYEHPDMGGWEPTTTGGGGCFRVDRDGRRVPVPEEVAIWHRTCGVTLSMRHRPGDRLWVRETWAVHQNAAPQIYERGDMHLWGSPIYKATFSAALDPRCEGFTEWRSSAVMPRWASRITLLVTDVRVERVQDISEADAVAEGMVWRATTPEDIAKDHEYCRNVGIQPRQYLYGGAWLAPDVDRPNNGPWGTTAREAFRTLWSHLHGPAAWERNDWVSVTKFERVP